MPPDAATCDPEVPVTESPMVRLVLEAQSLQVLGNRLVMLVVAAGTLGEGQGAHVEGIRQVMDDLCATWDRLRDASGHLLDNQKPDLPQAMARAFTSDSTEVFDRFRAMAHAVRMQLLRDDAPSAGTLHELVRFASQDLRRTFEAILATARKVADMGNEEAERQKLTDELTGLPNRRGLRDLVQQTEVMGWPREYVTILHMDLDRLKHFNDALGHAAGDAALLHASATFSQLMGPGDFLARVGGDEFVLVCFSSTPDADIAKRAEELLATLSIPFIHGGKECVVGGSIGIACGSRSEGLSLERYVNNADLALHTSKNAGRGTFRFFAPNLRTRSEEIEELQSLIREGLTSRQFEPYFQPQVDGRTGHIVGFESLARWHHPTRGLLTPIHFLKAAKDGGLLDQLDRMLMEQTFGAMRGWLDRGLRVPQVSINLSASRLVETDLVDTLVFAADQTDLDPVMVGVEILESAMIDNGSRQIIENIQNLSAAGFRVELDDFGTGHAAISHLRNFKVDRIKIDRSFVKDVHLFSELAKITSAMIGLAHSLRVDALAEGVETPEERLVLNALGCDHIQGFGVARPMPSSDVPGWLGKTQRAMILPPRRLKRTG